MSWTAFWARLGWEAVPIVIVLGAFTVFFAIIFAVAAITDLCARIKRAVNKL